MVGTAQEIDGPLLGREAETERIARLLDGIETGGGALVLRGEPGIGKSRLLAEAAARAHHRGTTMLSATGVQSEAHLAFSGLHQLLRPVRDRAADLPPVHRAALDAAFGVEDDAPPEHFRIAMAALDLLSEVAAERPLLVIVEDAHWLDGPSADVLAFVARRIESDSIVLLAATRDGYHSALGHGELPEHRLSALDRQSAADLLDWAAAGLAEAERNRVLLEASGTPLALIELPGVVGRVQDSPIPGLAPLSERLERAFAARIADLPERTRLLLLVAALNDGDQLSEVLAAGNLVAGAALDLESLEPAAEASVIALDERTVRFRHPLVRSAVRQEASAPQRRRVHEALANTLYSDPDRRVWHRAALISGAHQEVAMELEAAGRRARRRGATGVAFTALRRAAELSEPAGRIPRLLAAAELAFELGEPGEVPPLLQEVARLEPGRLERARAIWIEEVVHPRPLADGARATALIAEAGRAGEAGDRELQLDLLWLVAQRAWWSDPGPKAREVLIEAADGLGDLASSDARCSRFRRTRTRSATRPRRCRDCRQLRLTPAPRPTMRGTWAQRRRSLEPSTSP